jgi:uncharacterized protein (TIGR00255 family)
MTGYGRAQESLHGREITVEVRSVNNRYLDCTVKLPRAYAFAEDPVRQRIKSRITRGKTDVYITVNTSEDENVNITLNRPVLEGYLNALRTIAKDYGVREDVSVMSLARLPDVLTVEKQEEDAEQISADILLVLDQALDKYDEMREKEGAAMEADVRGRAATIESLVAKVEARSPETVAEYRARLTAKMQEVLSGAAVDESRLLTEAAIYADKVAVDEETVRLRSHLSQMDQMLTGGGAVGRKLDFLMQEMNREANTIGSKCSDVALARVVVDIKAELEKIREQIQNIE